jgi:pumilio homology domain family member 6
VSGEQCEYEVLRCRKRLIGSKKDVSLRRAELLEAVSLELISVVTANVEEAMRDPLANQVVQEILLYAKGILSHMSDLILGDKSKALEAVAQIAAEDPSQENHILRLPFAARVYKTLVQGGHYNSKENKLEGIPFTESLLTTVVDPPLNFATTLYGKIKQHVVQWACGEGSFVVLALLETFSPGQADPLKKQLLKELMTLKQSENKGTKIILEKIS